MSQPLIPSLHPDFSYRVDLVGNERQPVLVIDNFIANAESLVDYCCQATHLNAENGFYPGMRGAGPGLYMDAVSKHLGALISKTFQLSSHTQRKMRSVYSMVTTPPDELSPLQCAPHCDSTLMSDLASVHYLCQPHHGGTSLYRHIDTGFEYVDGARKEQYRHIVAAQEQRPDFPRTYMNGSNAFFERIASYEARFNRVVIYRSTSLHSGNITPDFNFDSNPRTGRLTLNTFIYTPKE